MATPQIGDRVIAIRSTDNASKKVFAYGAGRYVGKQVPTHIPVFAELNMPNHAIELDKGGVVFGCECWWGSEDKMREKFDGYEFIEVSIEEDRAEAKQ